MAAAAIVWWDLSSAELLQAWGTGVDPGSDGAAGGNLSFLGIRNPLKRSWGFWSGVAQGPKAWWQEAKEWHTRTWSPKDCHS